MTYKTAKANHLQALSRMDWDIVSFRYGKVLKTPYACDPDTGYRMYFKNQSVYFGRQRPEYSLRVDMRRMSTDDLVSIFHWRVADEDVYMHKRI